MAKYLVCTSFTEREIEADYFYTNLAGEVVASFYVEDDGKELVHAVIGPCVIMKIA